MSVESVSAADNLPIDPYCWRCLPVNLGLCVASWAALLAWLLGGSDGAGNLFAVWSWFLAVVFTIVVAAKPRRLTRSAPMMLRWFFRLSYVAQVGVLAWFGCWWVFAPTLWAFVMAAAQSSYVARRIAQQEATQHA